MALLLEALAETDARTVVVGFGPERDALEEAAGDRVLFTGPLEHRHLAYLWPLADVSVTPSVFPEAFGMVAAEAAACGSPPLVARHSGLAEIAEGLEAEYPVELPRARRLRTGRRRRPLPRSSRRSSASRRPSGAALGEAARRAVVARWSWEHIASALLSL